MASAFGHAIAALAFSQPFSRKVYSIKFWVIGIFCSIIPDIDVIGFKYNIPYESPWGHRGATHSLLFALIFGLLMVLIFYRKYLFSKNGFLLSFYFISCTASHGVLDAMTSGGKGVGFFLPWDTTRYFFPFRVIKVSPLGFRNFFSTWGLNVLESEVIWIGIPAMGFILISIFLRRNFKKS